MRLRNKIIAMAVVAVAGFNTYLANDIRVQRNELSLLNLENIAEAQEEEPAEINPSDTTTNQSSSKGFDCVPVTCKRFSIEWESTELGWVEGGRLLPYICPGC